MVLTREVEGQGLSRLGGQGALPILEEDRNPIRDLRSWRDPPGALSVEGRGLRAVFVVQCGGEEKEHRLHRWYNS